MGHGLALAHSTDSYGGTPGRACQNNAGHSAPKAPVVAGTTRLATPVFSSSFLDVFTDCYLSIMIVNKEFKVGEPTAQMLLLCALLLLP